ncbi:L,D-transpeptidase [Nitratireductor sp. GISD-1A_MAKvit]|uniref:L,D-transpeptidase n=1 Tax=Nitratireductor sp. GISD-1A_MAKvit TaxID=3234198 RepID=UPI0034653E10
MKRIFFAVAIAGLILSGGVVQGFAASLVAKVSVSKQTMTVVHRGRVLHRWRVSTARRGYVTPRGRWRPKRMHKMWHSRKYNMSPMPYSIFYYGGYAIHGTNAVSKLGRPASHGCVRLHTANAKRLYALVKKIGPGNTRIVVTD